MKNIVKAAVVATIAMTSTAFAGAILPVERNAQGIVEIHHLNSADRKAIFYGQKNNDFVKWDSHVRRGSVTIKNYGAFSLSVGYNGGYRTVVTGQAITVYGNTHGNVAVKLECAGFGEVSLSQPGDKKHYLRTYNGNCFNAWVREFDASSNPHGGAEIPTDISNKLAPGKRAYTPAQ